MYMLMAQDCEKGSAVSVKMKLDVGLIYLL